MIERVGGCVFFHTVTSSSSMDQQKISAILGPDRKHLKTLIFDLMSPSNEQRSKAEFLFNLCKEDCGDNLVANLAKLLEHSPRLHTLKELNLSYCNLEEVPESIGGSSYLRLEGCKKLEVLPELPHPQRSVSLEGLHMLKKLNLSYRNLELQLEGNNFTSLPGSLSQLKYVRLEGCKKLEVMPELPHRLSDCTSLREVPESSKDPFRINDVRNCPKLFKNVTIDSEGYISKTQCLDSSNTSQGSIHQLSAFPGNLGLPCQLSAMSAILLRNLVQDELPEMTRSRVKSCLLNCVVNEQNKPIIKILGNTISKLVADNGWPELMTFMFNGFAADNDWLKESALLIFAQLGAQYVRQSLVPRKTDLHKVFMDCLGNGGTADVRIAALSAVINFIPCLDYSDSCKFKDLLPRMFQCVTAALNPGNEATAQKALVLLIELAGTRPRFFEGRGRRRGQMVEVFEVVEDVLQIAKAESLEEGTRHLAIEFVITLAEEKMWDFPQFIINRLCAILMRMLLDIEDENEDEDAGRSSNYSVGKECLHRLATALDGISIVPVVYEYLSAPNHEWRKHLAGLVALAQIVEGCSKLVEIPNLEQVVTMVLNSFEYHPDHPRVRWAAINGIGQLSTCVGPSLLDQYHNRVLPALDSALGDVQNPRVQTMSTSSSSKRAPDLSEEIRGHFERSLRLCYPELDESCEFADMKGEALEKYGDDYICSSVLKISTKLRSKDPELFSKTGSGDIAKFIVKNLQKSDMIPQVSIHNGCFLTFKLSWEWMAKRINTMLVNGIKTWAPAYGIRTVVLINPESDTGSILHADPIRATSIRETLSHMFYYSGVEVFIVDRNLAEPEVWQANTEVGKHFLIEQGVIKKGSGRMHEHPLFVAAKTEELELRNETAFIDLVKLWVGIYKLKADFIVYVAPVCRGGYIKRCLAAARDVQWLNDDEMACHCGYRTSSNEREKLNCLLYEFYRYFKRHFIVELAKEVGYKTTEAVYGFAVKYAYLKNNRFVEFPWSIDELFDEKGNTFVYLLHTRALVLSVIKNPRRGTFKLTKAFVAKERELALHLVRFTDEVRESCLAMMPHILCQYLWDLCKKFTSCYGEVRPVENRLLLCRATSVVMEKCFDILRISPTCSSGPVLPVNPFIPWSADVSDARLKNLNPRIELFSIFVSISADFEEGHLCGDIELVDFNGLEYGWLKSDNKDLGHVSYFSRDWSNPLPIRNESYIYLGNPSSRYALSLASTIEIHTDLIVTSEKNGALKEACFELSRGMQEFDKSDFWQNEDKRTECGTMAFESESGFIQIHYILLKDAMDATMELSFESLNSRGLKVRGHISAYYGRGVLDECEEAQKVYHHALIFKTDGMLVLPGQKLDLRKSVLAVPANGDLILDASFKDSKSGETIVDDKVIYSVVTNKGFKKWEIPVLVEGKTLVGNFNLKLEWIKGPGIFG